MEPAQMKFLRLLSMRITQNVTYHCYNSRAWEDDNDRTIKLQGENEMELTSSDKTKPKVVTNSCDVSIYFIAHISFERATKQVGLFFFFSVRLKITKLGQKSSAWF